MAPTTMLVLPPWLVGIASVAAHFLAVASLFVDAVVAYFFVQHGEIAWAMAIILAFCTSIVASCALVCLDQDACLTAREKLLCCAASFLGLASAAQRALCDAYASSPTRGYADAFHEDGQRERRRALRRGASEHDLVASARSAASAVCATAALVAGQPADVPPTWLVGALACALANLTISLTRCRGHSHARAEEQKAHRSSPCTQLACFAAIAVTHACTVGAVGSQLGVIARGGASFWLGTSLLLLHASSQVEASSGVPPGIHALAGLVALGVVAFPTCAFCAAFDVAPLAVAVPVASLCLWRASGSEVDRFARRVAWLGVLWAVAIVAAATDAQLIPCVGHTPAAQRGTGTCSLLTRRLFTASLSISAVLGSYRGGSEAMHVPWAALAATLAGMHALDLLAACYLLRHDHRALAAAAGRAQTGPHPLERSVPYMDMDASMTAALNAAPRGVRYSADADPATTYRDTIDSLPPPMTYEEDAPHHAKPRGPACSLAELLGASGSGAEGGGGTALEPAPAPGSTTVRPLAMTTEATQRMMAALSPEDLAIATQLAAPRAAEGAPGMWACCCCVGYTRRTRRHACQLGCGAIVLAAYGFILAAATAVVDPYAAQWAARHAGLRGVNAGGWLVAERWMVGDASVHTMCCGDIPGPYRGIGYAAAPSERQLSRILAATHQTQRLLAFRERYLTRVDFVAMAKSGVRSVRVPFAAWEVADGLCGGGPHEGYVYGRGIAYLDDAVRWAGDAGLQLILDLHGACGGQSGAQSSGDLDASWVPARFNASASLEAVRLVASRYATTRHVIGIELLNEPMLPTPQLLAFYRDASRAVRAAGMPPERVAIILNLFLFSELYQRAWAAINWELPARDFPNVVYDWHLYFACARRPRTRQTRPPSKPGRRRRRRRSACVAAVIGILMPRAVPSRRCRSDVTCALANCHPPFSPPCPRMSARAQSTFTRACRSMCSAACPSSPRSPSRPPRPSSPSVAGRASWASSRSRCRSGGPRRTSSRASHRTSATR